MLMTILNCLVHMKKEEKEKEHACTHTLTIIDDHTFSKLTREAHMQTHIDTHTPANHGKTSMMGNTHPVTS